MMSDLTIVSSIVIFLTCLAFLNLLLPVAYQFVSITSLTWLSGATVAVGGVCVVATGLPCAAAMAIYFGATFLIAYFTSTGYAQPIMTMIFSVISIILIIFMARLARGVAGGG